VKILVTGSAGHLGEALMRVLRKTNDDIAGLDIKSSPFTNHVGSVADRQFVRRCIQGVNAVLHTATLHKPHIATHSRQEFIDTNITGTLNLLEEAVATGVESFVFTSTTSVFGHALKPADGQGALWIDEDVSPRPRNIYGITKLAAEHLCELFHLRSGVSCIVLRTSRFFPEEDDDRFARQAYDDDNLKVNEFLYRRADIEDVAAAHILAIGKAPQIRFGRYLISATTPFNRSDLEELRTDAPSVVKRYVPDYEQVYAARGWTMARSIERVYVNERARAALQWRPTYDFAQVIRRMGSSGDHRSPLAQAVGSKGYHAERFREGPYPTE
jgi:UDP-glucose 4-epimerase